MEKLQLKNTVFVCPPETEQTQNIVPRKQNHKGSYLTQMPNVMVLTKLIVLERILKRSKFIQVNNLSACFLDLLFPRQTFMDSGMTHIEGKLFLLK